MAERALHVDPDKTWISLSMLVVMIAGTITVMGGGYALYSGQQDFRSELRLIAREVSDMAENFKEVRDAMNSLRLDTVLSRQAQMWIELARAANKAKYPDIIWPDLPR